jgi:hypothetical protein
MTRIIFRKGLDVEVQYQHEDGKIERLPISRIVKAYADVSGIEFCYTAEGPYGIGRTIDTTLDFGVTEEKGKHYLSVHGFLFELPDITKQWDSKDTERIWNGLKYLMRM